YSDIGIPDYAEWGRQLGRMPAGTDFNPGSAAMRKVVEDSSRIDYSGEALPTLRRHPSGLDQNGQPRWWELDANAGVGAAAGNATTWFDPTTALQVGDAHGALDWDGDGALSSSVDVNIMGGLETCITPGMNRNLDSSPPPGDQRVGQTVFAGPNGKC